MRWGEELAFIARGRAASIHPTAESIHSRKLARHRGYERGAETIRAISASLALFSPPLRLPVCVAGAILVPFEGGSVSSYIPSVVRRDQASVALLAVALRHSHPRSLDPGH
jgi:hypothetical protein